MATPTPTTPKRSARPQPVPDTVDPRWLVKAILVTIVAAVVCAWLAVCLLVWQGAWQLVLHPSAKLDRTPAVPFDAVRFDAAATGSPRLAGWWIPAPSPASPTVLFLHDGNGNLASNIDRLTLLHNANLNVFAFDYRGFGQSEGPHPTEARMSEDTAAALNYLVETRHIPAASILPEGVGLGGTLAVRLAEAHPELPVVILDDPDPALVPRTLRERGTTGVPVGLLLRDRFDLAGALPTLVQPKLVLLGGPETPDAGFLASIPSPKMTVTLPPTDSPVRARLPDRDTAYTQAIRRFLDQYVPARN